MSLLSFNQIFAGKVRRFAADRRGSFATTIGISALAVMLSAGVAVDYSRLAMTKTVMDDALDAAILAAGRDLAEGSKSDSELEADFRDFFLANIDGRSHYGENVRIVAFDADERTGTVTAEARADVSMAFMSLAGKNSVDLGSPAEVRFATDAIEIAMALDVTGSMRGSKIAALRQAAANAVEILLPKETDSDKIRIGLVPYAEAVNAGPWARRASGNLSADCVTERGGRNAFNDAGWRGPNGPVGAQHNDCPRETVFPLSNDRDLLLDRIGALRTYNYTAGHIGIAWSYYMLSENWRSLWPRENEPRRYDDKVHKVAIIMTDGLFNTYYDGVRGGNFGTNETVAKSNAAALALCDDMKQNKGTADGVAVYTIAFELGRSLEERNALAMMQACATDEDHFFNARDGEELKQAFEEIALNIQKLRLSR